MSSVFTYREHFEEEEEEKEEGVDDELLGELADESLEDDLLGEEVLEVVIPPVDPLEEEGTNENRLYGEDDAGEDDEEDMDYDSFDDHDEL